MHYKIRLRGGYVVLIDFDGVIVNTVKMFVELNNELNGLNENYLDVDSWNFRPICNNLKTKADVDELFKHKKLYENPEFFPNAIEVINKLNEKYEIAICTMGSKENIINKMNLFIKYFPNIKIITLSDEIKSKNILNSDILLDDHVKNLKGFKGVPILFEPIKSMSGTLTGQD